MKPRYVLFYILSTISISFFWYYCMAFCAIYPVTSIAWATQSATSIAMGWGVFELAEPISGGMVRSFVRRFNKLL
jgi:hypothetical protein